MNDIQNGAGRVPGPMPPGAEAYASAMMRSLAGRSPEARQVLYEQLRTLWHVVNDPFPAASYGSGAGAGGIRRCTCAS